jgi:predicted HTH domain antitoxin
MPVVIAEETLRAARLSPSEFKQEIAVLLFEQNRLTLSQASHLAEMPLLRFQHLLASREIPLHYDIADFEADLATLDTLHPA